jgi:hypothetical protein
MNNWSQTAQLRGIFLAVGGILSLMILAFTDASKAMISLSITTTIAGFIGFADNGHVPPEKLIPSLEKVDMVVNPAINSSIVATKKPDNAGQ